MNDAYKEALRAIDARHHGIFDSPDPVALGPLTTVEADVTEIQRRYLVEYCGFTVGPRDPRVNTRYDGAFMVIEPHDNEELPTMDGSDGPWAIVGDDLSALIACAFSLWEDWGQ
jgi:hypothetical protein